MVQIIKYFISKLVFFIILQNVIFTFSASSEPSHGIAMYGDPQLPHDFVSLPYVSTNSKTGGVLIYGERGGFDSMNPYIRKGRSPWGVRAHVVESLMGRNWDEPFSLYGLLAESIEVGPNREWVEFALRPEAKFSDGSSVTVEDVIWSFETTGTVGHPRYLNSWKKIENISKTGPLTIKFEFNSVDLELPLILGLRPILKKADWNDRDFSKSSLDIITGSGPYKIGSYEPNRFITFERNTDYWGAEIAFNKGKHNFDQIKYEYFADGSGIFEAFKAGLINIYRENNISRWESSYDFLRATNGEILKSEIPHQRPTGIRGFVMNTRKEIFRDWRVRDALIHAFNYEFINQTINSTKQPRITSYFSNSTLGMREGEASGLVLKYLEPYKDELIPGVLDGYHLPVSNGDIRNRQNIRIARSQLKLAGWNVIDGELQNANGKKFEFNILLESGSNENEAIMNIFIDSLKKLGINAEISIVDNAQFKARTRTYDFDLTFYRRYLSLSPGNEQKLYWGSEGRDKEGTRNYMGVSSLAIDKMIDNLLSSNSYDEFIAASRALDRLLTAGRYVIPIWYNPVSRLAHSANLKFPVKLPMYGDWTGFLPDVWWSE